MKIGFANTFENLVHVVTVPCKQQREDQIQVFVEGKGVEHTIGKEFILFLSRVRLSRS